MRNCRPARIKRRELEGVRKRLEELAGGRPNDATRWNADNPNAAHIYRILLHLEWAEAHPQSLGFQPPEALEALRHVQPAVRAAADDDVVIEEQQAAETGISMKVREAEMLNLSQRYQQIHHKINNVDNKSLPILMRAALVFDDSYSKLLNWVGMMEKIRPTMRIGRITLSKGSRGDDLRMDVTLEVPLRNATKK